MDPIGRIIEQPSGRRILVVGLARSGAAAARMLSERGALVSGTDRRDSVETAEELKRAGVELILGNEPVSQISSFELIVLSPGVPLTSLLPTEAAARGVPVIGEMELGARLVRLPILAVTGTNGKSTTTALCAHLLELGGYRVFLGGNIGNPLCNLLIEKREVDWVVVEVSSFQIEHLTAAEFFVPRIGIWLNLTPDHLDRHGSLENYSRFKRRMFEAQGPEQTGVFFLDDQDVRRSMDGLRCRVAGFTRESERLTPGGLLIAGRDLRLPARGIRFELTTQRLLGGHNAEDAAAAVLATLNAGVDAGCIQEGLDSFPGLPHRLEPVDEIDGVRYVNDSKGTNIDATAKSLVSFDGPILLIAGGRGKGAPYLPLRELVAKHVKHLVLLGEDSERLAQDLRGCAPIHRVASMAEAVQLGRDLALPGDVVLLSPACASFDMFKDYIHRGEVFKELVRGLRERR